MNAVPKRKPPPSVTINPGTAATGPGLNAKRWEATGSAVHSATVEVAQ